MKLRIIIIDDEECVRDSFRLYLEGLGHEVIAAPEPMACDIYHSADCAEHFPCGDMLLVDQVMPRMTGLEFIDHMHKRGCKGNPANKYIMTGNVAYVDVDAVAKVGCNVLQKPVTLEKLDELLAQVRSRLKPNRKLTPVENIQKKAQAAMV